MNLISCYIRALAKGVLIAKFLVFDTPKTNPRKMCQMLKIFGICYSIDLSMGRFGHMLYLFFVHFLITFLSPLVKYLCFSLSQPLILSPSYSLSLSQPLIISPSDSFSHPLNIDRMPLIKQE